MMKKISLIMFLTVVICQNLVAGKLETRIGILEFDNVSPKEGIPTPETVEKIFNEIDFQRATQVYIWSVPYMGFYQWWFEYEKRGIEVGQTVYYHGHQPKIGGLTFNTSTPYAITFMDLTEKPVLVTIPENVPLRGAVSTMWQVGLAQMTKTGNYVFVGPGQEIPKDIPKEYEVYQSETNFLFLGVRLVNKDESKWEEDLKSLKVTFLDGKKVSEKPILVVEKGYDLQQARGIAFWESLHKAINIDPVREQDRIIMDMLRPLGIEKGKPFEPTDKQKKILEEAVLVGEAMVKTIDFNKTERLPHSTYGPRGNTWEIATVSSPNQDRDYGVDLDGRAAWFYEAVTNDIAMHGMNNHDSNPEGKYAGWGQVYLDNYRDSDGNGLNGSNHYTITLNDVNYADFFWTITVYNVENRAIIDNDIQRADVGSNIEGTTKNKDGSYTFHFSPKKPKGIAKANWVQTIPGKNWFVYFRAYSPSEEFVNQEPDYVIPNFVKVND